MADEQEEAKPEGSAATWFKPGHKGGPGRPKGPTYADTIRKVGMEITDYHGDKMTWMECLIRKTFIEAKAGKSWAMQFLVDRAEGRAVQRQEIKTEAVDNIDRDSVKRQILTAAAEIQAWEAQKKKEPEAGGQPAKSG